MRSWRMRVLAGFFAVAAVWQPLVAQFGELPANHVNRLALDGVRGEIGFYFLIDSAAVATSVPVGLQVLTLQRLAAQDSVTAHFLSSRSHLNAAVPGVLLFGLLDSLTIDAREPVPWVLAAWWVPLLSSESVDARVRGETSLQVASWSPDTAFVRLLRPVWAELRIAPVTVERLNDGEWHVSLALPEGKIRGRCRPSGDRKPVVNPLPQYNTVWNTGTRPASFTVYTSYGQHSQDCVGELTAEGSGFLVSAVMRSPRELVPWMKAAFLDGWRARAGVYRH